MCNVPVCSLGDVGFDIVAHRRDLQDQLHKLDLIRAAPTPEERKKLSKAYGLKADKNPFLDNIRAGLFIAFDPYEQTPPDPSHQFSGGLCKAFLAVGLGWSWLRLLVAFPLSRAELFWYSCPFFLPPCIHWLVQSALLPCASFAFPCLSLLAALAPPTVPFSFSHLVVIMACLRCLAFS